jgi:ubiquinone/menaquinone biosynthesis C-methylase UbiE
MALRRMLTGCWLSQSIYVIAKVGAADLLSGGPQSSEDLSKALRVDANALYRIMRTLTSYGLFEEDDKHRFGLTPLGTLLQTGVPGSMRAMAIWNGETAYRAWGAVLHTIETGQPALGHVLGMKLFDYLAQNHETGRIFDEAMTGLSVQVSQAVVANYDFSGVKTIVDVAGGQGVLVAAILQAYPEMGAILFDMPSVIEGSRKQLEAFGIAGRCEVVAGDFFEFIPKGGDCYILSSVIHDWDDEQSLRILRQCRGAMDQGSRLLLVECMIPDSPEPVFSKLLDLQMLVMTGGRERTEPQFKDLLASAKFRLTNIIPTAVPECIVEALAV